tara:strand:- start:7657 stop:8250 length:594 start_codon:yes stop_codon:yes gene_type:complete
MSELYEHEGMRQIIPGYEPGSGDPERDAALQDISKMFGGLIPNFHKVLANSWAVVKAFEAMRRNLQKTELRAIEREIVSVEVSRRTKCHYCMSAHSNFAKQMKMSHADIQAMREGRPMSDPRHALVQRAAKRIWDTQGRLSEQEIKQFNDEGLSVAELFEVIAVIGWYVTSTLSNNLDRTEIDPQFRYDEDTQDAAA